jgi:nucleoside-diphosphate-sugar epimerase
MNMEREKVTLIGGNGSLGQHFSNFFKKNNIDYFIPEKGDISFFKENSGNVFYLAGLTSDFRTRPFETVEAHVCFLKNFLQKASFQSLTYFSSTRVYSGAENTSEHADLHLNPSNASDLYNFSKLMGEALCLHSGHKNVKVVRLSNVVSFRHDTDIFLNQILSEGKKSGKIFLKSHPDSSKDYIYIDDVVEIIIKIAISTHTGIFNIASGESISNITLLEMIKKVLRFDFELSTSEPIQIFKKIDTRKISTLVGANPRPFHDYFPAFLEKFSKNDKLF